LWDDENGSTTANLSNLNGGKYMVNIIDAHGCEIDNGAVLRMPIAKDWSRQGNANIDPSEFIGSTDTSAVVFKTNSQEAMRLMGNGNVELAGDLKLRNLASNLQEVNLKLKWMHRIIFHLEECAQNCQVGLLPTLE
jgi:hypothetical protein